MDLPITLYVATFITGCRGNGVLTLQVEWAAINYISPVDRLTTEKLKPCLFSRLELLMSTEIELWENQQYRAMIKGTDIVHCIYFFEFNVVTNMQLEERDKDTF